MSKTFRVAALLAILLGISLNSLRAAETPQPIPLWPDKAPGEKGDIGAEHEQPQKDTVTRITDVTAPTITIYRPPADKDTKTAVVICPGGGYNILAWNLEGTEIADWLNSIGVTGIVLKYRVPARKGQEKHLAPLQDLQRAIGMARHRASEIGIDPGRIGVLGFSAGGHLAATVSNNFEQRSYEPIDAADQVSCRPDFSVLIYPAYLLKEKGPELAPELKITSNTPRTLLIHTEDDPIPCEGSLFYYLALKKEKVQGEIHVYPTGGHGYGLRPTKNMVCKWPDRAEQWLQTLGLLEAPK
jgi:acetyl esterase/lipase